MHVGHFSPVCYQLSIGVFVLCESVTNLTRIRLCGVFGWIILYVAILSHEHDIVDSEGFTVTVLFISSLCRSEPEWCLHILQDCLLLVWPGLQIAIT